NLKNWQFLKNIKILNELISLRDISDIHGDLTVENIIVDGSLSRGWYLIDPNPVNIFNTPLIDWAKLYQSFHTYYELLNKGVACNLLGNQITYTVPRIFAYEKLYQSLRCEAVSRWGIEGEREIRLHEIIHYLRLTPYKFRFGFESGILFFAVCCQLIDQYRNDYGSAIRSSV
ncbi:hypothetical protein Rin_00005390, partial [Candidatus Regiella insecticola 5.15]